MNSDHGDTVTELRATGLRVTPQRLAVLEYLRQTDRHPTAEDVGSAVNARLPTVSRASVYNVLRSLREAGLVREVVAGDAITRYDAEVAPHHHFVCSACGVVEDIPWSAALVDGPGVVDGRAIEHYEVVFHGQCARCA